VFGRSLLVVFADMSSLLSHLLSPFLLHVLQRGITPALLMRWMAENPARLANLHDRKGAIRVGLDADLLIFDDTKPFVVRGEDLHHRHKLTPYEGRTVLGSVATTILRGNVVYEEGQLCAPSPLGEMLLLK